MGTFKWKKKGFGKPNASSQDSKGKKVPSGSSDHESWSPLSIKATSSFSRIFSFRNPRSKHSPFPTPSRKSATIDRDEHDDSMGLVEASHNSYSEDDIVHHSVTSLPTLSANMAAIEARTFAASDPLARNQQVDCLPDRAEASNVTRTQGDPNLVSKQSEESGSSLVSKPSVEVSYLSQNWLIDANDLTTGKTIGHSSFGAVTEGKFKGTKVAVKTIQRDVKMSNNFETFKKEAELNCQMRHPNIVLFMGISIQPTQVCIITELMSRGNVRDLLVGNSKGKKIRLDWQLRQQWALDTAQGMGYLHSHNPPMIHRDLKTTNLLVDRGMNVKICDFGLSRIRSDKPMSVVGTVQFSAPEILRHEQYTEKVDVFSFGTVLWELYTRRAVFQGIPQIEVYNAVIEGKMPTVDSNCDARYEGLMRSCWALNPAERPDFQDIIERPTVLVEETEASG